MAFSSSDFSITDSTQSTSIFYSQFPRIGTDYNFGGNSALNIATISDEDNTSVIDLKNASSQCEIKTNTKITGDLEVSGTTTTVSSTALSIADVNILVGSNNSADICDLGLYGLYNDGTAKYSGLFRDCSDSGTFKLFKGLAVAPTTTIDTSDGSFSLADLNINALAMGGNLTGYSKSYHSYHNSNIGTDTTDIMLKVLSTDMGQGDGCSFCIEMIDGLGGRVMMTGSIIKEGYGTCRADIKLNQTDGYNLTGIGLSDDGKEFYVQLQPSISYELYDVWILNRFGGDNGTNLNGWTIDTGNTRVSMSTWETANPNYNFIEIAPYDNVELSISNNPICDKFTGGASGTFHLNQLTEASGEINLNNVLNTRTSAETATYQYNYGIDCKSVDHNYYLNTNLYHQLPCSTSDIILAGQGTQNVAVGKLTTAECRLDVNGLIKGSAFYTAKDNDTININTTATPWIKLFQCNTANLTTAKFSCYIYDATRRTTINFSLSHVQTELISVKCDIITSANEFVIELGIGQATESDDNKMAIYVKSGDNGTEDVYIYRCIENEDSNFTAWALTDFDSDTHLYATGSTPAQTPPQIGAIHQIQTYVLTDFGANNSSQTLYITPSTITNHLLETDMIKCRDSLKINRPDTSSYAQVDYDTNSVTDWKVGMRSGDSYLHFYDTSTAKSQLIVRENGIRLYNDIAVIGHLGATRLDISSGEGSVNVESVNFLSGAVSNVISLECTTLTATNINSTTTDTLTFPSPPFSETRDLTFTLYKLGSLVTITFPIFQYASSSASENTDMESSTGITSSYRPTSNKCFPIAILDDGDSQPVMGMLCIFTTGIIRIYKSWGGTVPYFTENGNDIGIESSSVQYILGV